MPRYIDADAVKQLILTDGLYCDNQEDKEYSASLIDEIPTADVVERRKGDWIVIMNEPTITFDECICSECGTVEYFNKGWKKFNFCPNCGAQMDSKKPAKPEKSKGEKEHEKRKDKGSGEDRNPEAGKL